MVTPAPRHRQGTSSLLPGPPCRIRQQLARTGRRRRTRADPGRRHGRCCITMARSPRSVRSDENQASTKELIQRYARRMIIEQRLAEIIRSFGAGALSSTVNLNVDLDIMLAVVAQALLAALGTRLPATQSRPPAPSSARSWKTARSLLPLMAHRVPSLTGSSALRWRAVTCRRAPGATGCRGCAARIPAPCARRTSGRAPPTVHLLLTARLPPPRTQLPDAGGPEARSRARATVTRRLCTTAGFDECPPKKQSGLIPLLPVTFGSRAATVNRPHGGHGGQ